MPSFALFLFCTYTLIQDIRHSSSTIYIVFVMMPFWGIAFVVLMHCSLETLRRILFKPFDLPQIFNRENQKVYHLVEDPPYEFGRVKQFQSFLTLKGIKEAFRPRSIKLIELDWNDLVIEKYEVKTTPAGGGTYTTYLMALCFQNQDRDAVERINIGYPPPFFDPTMHDFECEHIRRYMHFEGPALPEGVSLLNTALPRTWWENLGSSSAFGPGYFRSWSELPILMFFVHLFSPLTVPLAIFTATSSWLSYGTGYSVAWPQDVLEQAGQNLYETEL